MLKILNTLTTENAELNMYQCGIHNCRPDHKYGPAVRDHFLVHYILEGNGIYSVDGTEYSLGRGEGFLICPDVITFYQAGHKKPWTYTWAGFNGIKAAHYLGMAGLSRTSPIFSYKKDKRLEDCLRNMIESRDMGPGREFRLIGLLYQFMSLLVESHPPSNSQKPAVSDEHVNRAIRYMQKNYSRRISISEVARSTGLDRSYLGCLFRSKLGMSPREYLIGMRIEKACRLMINESLNISDISRSVGYEDPLHFSRMFKSIKKVPPSSYRKKLLENRGSDSCI